MFKKLCLGALMFVSLAYGSSESFLQLHEQESVAALPEDVVTLLEKRDECAHWIEEWAPNLEDAQKDNIEENVNRICLDVMDQRNALLEKYQDNPAILEHLN